MYLLQICFELFEGFQTREREQIQHLLKKGRREIFPKNATFGTLKQKSLDIVP